MKIIFNMKKLICLIIIFAATFKLNAQVDSITLDQCIDSALRNKNDIKAVRTDRIASGLQSKMILAGYLPKISVGYDFRYNIVIPAQIIPVGLFYPVPTDATQAIKFGLKWQQNLGLSLYQPLIDRTVKTHLAESRINEKIQDENIVSAESDLKYEVINSYLVIWLREKQLNASILDTIRTFNTYKLLETGFNEGRVYESDLNMARINHNNALSSFRQSFSELVKEKIYMSFLTGVSLNKMLRGIYDFRPFKKSGIFSVPSTPLFDSIASIRQIILNRELADGREKSERANHLPTLGIEGFVGTNQYSDQFNPVNNTGWYGNSYIGLSFKLPVVSGRGSGKRISQLRLQKESLDYRLKDKKADITSQNFKLIQDINMLEDQISLADENIDLMKSNLALYRDRFEKGRINSYDMLASETDLQKEVNDFEKLRAELYLKKLQLIRNSGMLGIFIERLK
jgi:outer membrane protein